MLKGKGFLVKLVLCGVVLGVIGNAAAYNSITKENILADVLLTELLNRMDKEMDPTNNYFDVDMDLPKNVDLVPRSSKNNAPADFEYQNMFGGPGNPSIRDQEYLRHSSFHQYMAGGLGELPDRYNTIVKSDASLPAYCNPPNPCPIGFDESRGCIADFANTAIFSREFQSAQECTCDSEHMFNCGSQDSSSGNNEMTSTMEKFLMHQFQNDNDIDSNNGVVKKFYRFPVSQATNPFLEGDKLPIAAKKGDHIHV